MSEFVWNGLDIPRAVKKEQQAQPGKQRHTRLGNCRGKTVIYAIGVGALLQGGRGISGVKFRLIFLLQPRPIGRIIT